MNPEERIEQIELILTDTNQHQCLSIKAHAPGTNKHDPGCIQMPPLQGTAHAAEDFVPYRVFPAQGVRSSRTCRRGDGFGGSGWPAESGGELAVSRPVGGVCRVAGKSLGSPNR